MIMEMFAKESEWLFAAAAVLKVLSASAGLRAVFLKTPSQYFSPENDDLFEGEP